MFLKVDKKAKVTDIEKRYFTVVKSYSFNSFYF